MKLVMRRLLCFNAVFRTPQYNIIMIILGIDPGFNKLGWAVIKKESSDFEIAAASFIETESGENFEKRILKIGEDMNKIIKKYKPDALAIEKLFFTTNQKTALRVAEVKGIVMYLVALAGISVFEFTPLEVKMAICGYGKADKKQIRDMLKLTLKNCALPKNDDACDAIAVSLTCFFLNKNLRCSEHRKLNLFQN